MARNDYTMEHIAYLAGHRRDRAFTPWRCVKCGCLWRQNDDGTWSLYDADQKPQACCDNAPMEVEPVQ
jgi:hypothetical protein